MGLDIVLAKAPARPAYWASISVAFFLAMPMGLPCWPIRFVTSFLGISRPIYFTFTSCCAYRPVGYHFCHVGALDLLPLFLGFHGPFTLLLPLIVPMGLLAVILTMFRPIGFLPLYLGFHDLFILLLPLIVPMSLLVVILVMLAHWVYYLFSWSSTAHLLYFYLLLCSWAC